MNIQLGIEATDEIMITEKPLVPPVLRAHSVGQEHWLSIGRIFGWIGFLLQYLDYGVSIGCESRMVASRP